MIRRRRVVLVPALALALALTGGGGLGLGVAFSVTCSALSTPQPVHVPAATTATTATTATAAIASNNKYMYFAESRADVLNLLNHPLQLQLATGELPLGSFRRLVRDRAVVLDGLRCATPPLLLLREEISRHGRESARWLAEAEAGGKTIDAPGDTARCCTCGGPHLDVDCPEDYETEGDGASPAALALRSVLQSHGLPGALAVLRSYGFCCARLLDAAEHEQCRLGSSISSTRSERAYRGWLEAHAVRWTRLADECEAKMAMAARSHVNVGGSHSLGGDQDQTASSSYSLCLSMFYNWIDSEATAATTGTGIRLDNGGEGQGSKIERLQDAIEALEPGYAAQRDKHRSFVADIIGANDAQARADAAERKVNAAAAYLAARKKKQQWTSTNQY